MMNSEQVLTHYQAVSELTGQMLDAARSRNWEGLAVLESHCADHVQALKQNEAAVTLSDELRAVKVRIIHTILAHDRAIRDLTQPWMAELSILLGNNRTERKLSMVYGASNT